jgi:valyl-tRNA synthetase
MPSKNYDASEEEKKIYQTWMQNGVGSPEIQAKVQNLDANAATHTILMPPPNLTGVLHAGHSFQHFLMDTLSRVNRQKGKLNLWFPGVDHAGIQLEGVMDKLIRKGEFDEQIREFLEKKND